MIEAVNITLSTALTIRLPHDHISISHRSAIAEREITIHRDKTVKLNLISCYVVCYQRDSSIGKTDCTSSGILTRQHYKII